MTSHDHRSDMDLDAAIEALARVPPPTGHLERVLASTGPGLEATPPAWRLALRQPPQTKVLPCVASDRDSVKNVLLELLYVIQERSED